MAIYGKTARQMLVDLINEGNPDLPFDIDTTNFDFTSPVVYTDPDGDHNTRVRVIAKPESPYVGNVLLTYRRLDLGDLFQGITPVVHRWIENSYDGYGSQNIQLHDLLPLYSKKYGITLEPSQIVSRTMYESYGVPDGRPVQLTATADSLVFIGRTDVLWRLGKRTLGDLIQVDELDGREYPNGNDFTDPDSRKTYLTPFTYPVDHSMENEQANKVLRYIGTGGTNLRTTAGSGSTKHLSQLLMDMINAQLPTDVGFRIEASGVSYTRPVTDGTVSITGLVAYRAALPHDDYPEANAEFFNTMAVIKIPEDCPWGTGDIYIHYNL